MGNPEPQPIRVFAAVVCEDSRYLVCQRPLAKRHGGLWEFPGGKLELGETMFDAARREMMEELGVTATAIGETLLSIADPGSPFVIEFVPTKFEGNPVCLEHIALNWFPVDDLLTLPLAPSDRRFVEHLLASRGRPSGE
jgi:mutator protein MutT